MTDHNTPSHSLFRRLIDRLRSRTASTEVDINYDTLVGVEHHGRVVLLIGRDGSRQPITFTTPRDATAWFGKAHAGLLARREELQHPPELARLGDTLSDVATRPWSTNEHLTTLLLSGLVRASVSGAVLERTDRGLSIRCHRYGRMHLGGTIVSTAGRELLAHLAGYLEGSTRGTVSLDGRFPGPPLSADIEPHPAGLHVRPKALTPAFADLSAWGAPQDATLTLRDLLSSGTGLLLIAGRSDSGKSTLVRLCETEARVLRAPGSEIALIDEITDLETASDALKRSEDNLVIAAIRAENADEAVRWLKSLRLRRSQLKTNIKGAVEPQLLPVECHRCSGEGCSHCHRSGVSHRVSQLTVARLASMFHEQDTVPPFERERRKLTA
ncbi:MAG: hypothetical protein ACPGU1_21610 [Myxococcota bacterium]